MGTHDQCLLWSYSATLRTSGRKETKRWTAFTENQQQLQPANTVRTSIRRFLDAAMVGRLRWPFRDVRVGRRRWIQNRLMEGGWLRGRRPDVSAREALKRIDAAPLAGPFEPSGLGLAANRTGRLPRGGHHGLRPSWRRQLALRTVPFRTPAEKNNAPPFRMSWRLLITVGIPTTSVSLRRTSRPLG